MLWAERRVLVEKTVTREKRRSRDQGARQRPGSGTEIRDREQQTKRE
jgi:hypothetical protein